MSKTLQLLRNSELYSSRELALSGLETKLSSASDGEMIIARYTNDDSEVETLLGIAYNGDNGTYYTIFDTEEIESSIAENTVSSSDSTINVTVTESEGTDLSVNIDNETIKQDENNNQVLYVVNALSDSEKSWIEDELFDTLFTVSISRSVSSFVFTGSDYTVTWTLTCKYDGTLVDLDSTPSGWTYSSTGTYVKTTTVTSSTSGSSISSGSVTCTYNERSKTASSVSCTFVKYSYIYKTTEDSLSSLDDIDFDSDATQMQSSTTNTISGTYSIDFTEGQYAYFIISSTSSVSSITQLGLNYVNSGESMTRTNYGTYTVYRSTQAMSASTQEVTVA